MIKLADILLELGTGNYVIAYHGAMNEFDRFKRINNYALGQGNLDGYYFAGTVDDAREYGDRVAKVKLNYKKMFTGHPFRHFEELNNIESPGFGAKSDDYKRYREIVNSDSVKEYFIENGYDIIHIRPQDHYRRIDEYIVFDPDNIEILEWE